MALDEAEEAEFNKQWFAAAFHLRRARKKEPGNEELKKWLAVAEQKLKEEQAKTAVPKVESPKEAGSDGNGKSSDSK